MEDEKEKLIKSIEAYALKHKGHVYFIAAFGTFKLDGDDDLVVGYGTKKIIKECLDDLQELLGKEKEEFITW